MVESAPHPPHNTITRAHGAVEVTFPHVNGWWNRRRLARRCRRHLGGHWWHSSDPMIESRCCQCGVGTDRPVTGKGGEPR